MLVGSSSERRRKGSKVRGNDHDEKKKKTKKKKKRKHEKERTAGVSVGLTGSVEEELHLGGSGGNDTPKVNERRSRLPLRKRGTKSQRVKEKGKYQRPALDGLLSGRECDVRR